MLATRLAFSAALLLPSCAFAQALPVTSCEEAGISLNAVTEMRIFANGSIKVFATDRTEPAAASFGVAVAIDRGDDLSTAESFCRHVAGLSGIDLKNLKASFDKAANVLTLAGAARSSDGEGRFSTKTLTISIGKGAPEGAMVKALLK